MKKIFILPLILIFASVVFCSATEKEKGKVLAKVGEKEITQSEIDKIINAMPEQYKARFESKEAKDNLLERVINSEIFHQEAQELKLEESCSVQEKFDLVKRDILISTYLEDLSKKIKIEQKEIESFYTKNLERYKEPMKVKASHILFKKEQKKDAEQALKDIKKDKTKFKKIAQEKSICPSGKKDGDLGWFSKGMMVKEFEDVAFKMKKGEISGLIETQFGIHIIKLDDIKDAEKKPLKDVEANIKQEIQTSKQKEAINKALKDLKKKYKVKNFNKK